MTHLALTLLLIASACVSETPNAAASPEADTAKADAPNEQNSPNLPGYAETWSHDDGAAERRPWNGYWWPFTAGGIDRSWLRGEESPARKWDRAFHQGRSTVAAWEYRHHSLGEDWFGHCDGYALASTVEPEPRRNVAVATADGGKVCFRPNDLKALLAEAYSCDYGQAIVALGEDCDQHSARTDDHGRILDAACRDVNPMALHVALSTLLGENGRAFYLDRSAGGGIWNYPVTAFKSELGEPRPREELSPYEQGLVADGTDAVIDVRTAVTFSAFTDAAGRVSRPTSTKTYTYWLEVELGSEGEMVLLGGEWTGGSRTDHPDALKIPVGGRWPGAQRVKYDVSDEVEWCNNPHIDYEQLKGLVERAAGAGESEC